MGWTHDDAEIAEKLERLRVRARDAYSAMRPRDAATTRWLCCEAGPLDDLDASDRERGDKAEWGLYDLAIHFGMIKAQKYR
jgi:hypothetical protein